jgi:hypothetical protein
MTIAFRTNDVTAASSPVVPRDGALLTGNIGLFDLSSKATYPAQANPIPNGTGLVNIGPGKSGAILGTAIPFVDRGLAFDTVGQTATLPSDWKLPTDCTDFAIIFWAKIPKNGYVTGGSSDRQTHLFGYADGGSFQYGIVLLSENSSGNLKGIQLFANDQGPVVSDSVVPDGNYHQYVTHWKVVSSSAVMQEFYVDRSPVFTRSDISYGGSLSQPAPRVPRLGQFGSFAPDGMRGTLGRILLHRLDTPGSPSLSTLMDADYAAAKPYFS